MFKDSSPFAIPSYRTLWLTNLAVNAGTMIQMVGAQWVLVERGASPQIVALVQTASSIPLVLISPLSGAISDAADRRQVMITAQAVLAVASVTLALLVWGGVAQPWLVLGAIFLAGCSLAFNGPAFMASVADTVPRPRLPDAVLANAVGLNIARSIGPGLGGMLIAATGALANFALAAAISLLLIVLLAHWRPGHLEIAPSGNAAPEEPLIGAISTGFRFAAKSPPIRAAILRAIAFGLAFSALQALMPLVAHELLGGGAGLFGALFASFGIGALTGAFTGGRLRRYLAAETIVRVCTVAAALAGVGIAFSHWAWFSAICVAVAGATWVVGFSIFNVTIQLASPRRIGGRTLSLYQMAAFTGIAGGSWIGGFFADHWGMTIALLAMSAIGTATLLVGLMLPIRPLEDTTPVT